MICIEDLNFAVGSFALREVCLQIEPEEYFVLLGPTGAGKTLLVECICGLSRINSGRILIADQDVTRWEPRRRGIGYLPQDYALFPHQTVGENIAFGLRKHGSSAAAVRQRVEELSGELGLSHLVGRYPGGLSGGEKQRVALARALAIQPQVLVLDEPVSALDEQTRDNLCRLLRQVHRSARTTMFHVCHNFAEMLSVATRVGIIQAGRIIQVGTPQEVLQRPRCQSVARFMQAGNVFAARARAEGQFLLLRRADGTVFRALRSAAQEADGDVFLMVRPENVALLSTPPESPVPPTLAPGTTVVEGTVTDVVNLGPLVRATVACGPEPVVGNSSRRVELIVSLGKREYEDRRIGVGRRVYLAVAPQDVHVMGE
jgi:ABC-type Fe3+/spermidine/putrescine transport system ATPase subunit